MVFVGFVYFSGVICLLRLTLDIVDVGWEERRLVSFGSRCGRFSFLWFGIFKDVRDEVRRGCFRIGRKERNI